MQDNAVVTNNPEISVAENTTIRQEALQHVSFILGIRGTEQTLSGMLLVI